MFISTNISQISNSEYWKVDVQRSVRVCSQNMEFRSSFATTWHLLYIRFSSIALATRCDDKATTSDEMACHLTIYITYLTNHYPSQGYLLILQTLC